MSFLLRLPFDNLPTSKHNPVMSNATTNRSKHAVASTLLSYADSCKALRRSWAFLAAGELKEVAALTSTWSPGQLRVRATRIAANLGKPRPAFEEVEAAIGWACAVAVVEAG